MESLRRRIEDIFLHTTGALVSHWYICRAVDRIMVEFENEIAKREAEKAATDEGTKERELPL